MTDAPGRLLASGRAADVFDLGDGTVLRRYRIDHDTAAEARIMRWAAEQGLPVPHVHRSEGPDLVMDHVAGPTMLEALQRRPWTLRRHARLLASLQSRIGALRAPSWVAPVRTGPPGDALLHLDLHPMNVLIGTDGPVVIDWTNAARGPAALDAGYSFVLMSTFEARRAFERFGQRAFASTFAGARGRAAVDELLLAACELRLADRATTDGERDAIRRLRARHAAR